jgi:hypothetical protein
VIISARELAKKVAVAEVGLPAAQRRKFSLFGETVLMDRNHGVGHK